MKKLVLIAALAAALTGLSCKTETPPEEPPAVAPAPAPPAAGASSVSAAGTKQAWIYFTKNHNKGTLPGQYNTDCVGIVGTERIGTQKGYKIMWHVKKNNGGNDDDKCDMLTDLTTVNLRFNTDVMGAAAMKKLTANAGGVIEGYVSTVAGDIGSLLDHKYQVYIGDTPAGPDPVVIVGCGSCGPPPTQ